MASEIALLGETHLRSLVKGLGYRLLGTLATVLIALVLTGQLDKSIQIGGLDLVVKILLYYAYERLWNFIGWGKAPVKFTRPTTDKQG